MKNNDLKQNLIGYLKNTLAEFVNNLWQDLTDQEKEEIRGILNE